MWGRESGHKPQARHHLLALKQLLIWWLLGLDSSCSLILTNWNNVKKKMKQPPSIYLSSIKMCRLRLKGLVQLWGIKLSMVQSSNCPYAVCLCHRHPSGPTRVTDVDHSIDQSGKTLKLHLKSWCPSLISMWWGLLYWERWTSLKIEIQSTLGIGFGNNMHAKGGNITKRKWTQIMWQILAYKYEACHCNLN